MRDELKKDGVVVEDTSKAGGEGASGGEVLKPVESAPASIERVSQPEPVVSEVVPRRDGGDDLPVPSARQEGEEAEAQAGEQGADATQSGGGAKKKKKGKKAKEPLDALSTTSVDQVEDALEECVPANNGDDKVVEPEPETTAAPSDEAQPALASTAEPAPQAQSTAAGDSLANLQQTVSLLIAERTELQSQVTGLNTALTAAKADAVLLDEGRALIARLEGEKGELEARLQELTGKADRVGGLEDDLASARQEVEQVRSERDGLEEELTEARRAADEGKKEVEEKVGELEKSLERSRERQGGLESELGRLRTVSLAQIAL